MIIREYSEEKMSNVFQDFIMEIAEFKEAKGEMKWWDKINPFTRWKIKKICRMLEDKVLGFRKYPITNEYLYEFQRTFVVYRDRHDYEYITVNYNPKDQFLPIFYHMVIGSPDRQDRAIIDIVGDTIKIENTLYGSVTSARGITEYPNSINERICNSVRHGIEEYLFSWLDE